MRQCVTRAAQRNDLTGLVERDLSIGMTPAHTHHIVCSVLV